jgi:polyisoprenoid-binding protein YceI/mono/diheme cytochrome c family protein
MKTALTCLSLLAALVLGATPGLASPTHFALAHNPAPEVRFTVDAPLDSITGVSQAVSGTVVFDLDTLELSSARIVADPKSFQTGISLRDEDLRDQFFEAGSWPEIVLAVQKLSRFSRNTLQEGERVQADAQGLFSLHGVTHVVTFPVELQRRGSQEGPRLTVRGKFDVKLADYQIRRPTRLFLKLGEVAQVSFEATFVGQEPAGTTTPLAQAGSEPPQAKAAAVSATAAVVLRRNTPPVVARPPRKPVRKLALGPTFEFAFNTPQGRGERLFNDASIGGPGNAVSCASCHATGDERFGLLQPGGTVRPSHSLYNSTQRPSWWQGFASNAGKASSICARLFMLRPAGLDEGEQHALLAYLAKVSPDPSPAFDYQTLTLTRHSTLGDPTRGDAKTGAKLTRRYCESCHAEGAMRPPLTPGLYEPDYLVARVRWQPGHDAKQMPPMTIDRLTDSELRDIVTYLAGDENERIFKRNRAPHAQAGAPAAASGISAR